MIVQKPLPGLSAPLWSPDHIFCHCVLADTDAKFEQLSMNTERTTQGIFFADLPDQVASLEINLRTATAIA